MWLRWGLLMLSVSCWQGRFCFAQEATIDVEGAEFFEKHIRPIFVEKCQACHSASSGKTQGGLALDSARGWQKGGDSGTAIVPGDVDASLLIQAIRHEEGGLQMPPAEAGGPLTPAEIDHLQEWVRRGAVDPRSDEVLRGGLTEHEIRNWWSLRPRQQVTVPEVQGQQLLQDHPVDRFVLQQLNARGLSLSPEADRRTLIRRLTYDLIGLPPTPQEVAAFLADDSPNAYEKVVLRLLDSPRYGERWGRHWLDLVRYADTAGENSDHPLPHAWKYRNWVIDAWQNNMPYDQFLCQQIAGDLMVEADDEQSSAKVIATGFLAIARRFDHDSDKFMHLTHEDAIDTIGKAFMGLTLGCARCHDHKFDAITAADYYALYGILESTKFSFPGCEAKQQPRDLVPLVSQSYLTDVVQPYEQAESRLTEQLSQLTQTELQLANELQQRFAAMRSVLSTGEIADGGESPLATTAHPLRVQRGDIVLLSITPLGNHGADTTQFDLQIVSKSSTTDPQDSGSPQEWLASAQLVPKLLNGNPGHDAQGNQNVWWFFDARNQPILLPEQIADEGGNEGLDVWRNGDTPSVFVNRSSSSINVWTTLPAGGLFAHPSPDGNVAIGWRSPLEGEIEFSGFLRDSHPGGPSGVGWVLEHFSLPEDDLLDRLAIASAEKRKCAMDLKELQAKRPKPEVAFAVTEGVAQHAKLHLRGDPEKLGEVVPRRWLEILGGQPLANPWQSGRLELADWITSADNPLTARVMVNRLWLHHFGKGIVKTANDFGTRGTLPSHPELLDWLANYFVESNWNIKEMHRLLVTSATYRQGSIPLSTQAELHGLERDVANDFYWRFERRRLSAEELRDSLLMLSGRLDLERGGPHPIPPEQSWSYTQHVPFAGVPETNQRSVFQLVVRNRRQPFMALFDGADPNASTPQRQVTTVPTQALYFMNDPFVHEQADLIVQRLREGVPQEERFQQLYLWLFQRSPSVAELERLREFVVSYAETDSESNSLDESIVWAAWVRILLASNEFLFLD